MSNPINLYEATVILQGGTQITASARAENMTYAERIIRAQYPNSTVTGMYQVNDNGSRTYG
jgi:hypothetical protein